VSTVDGDLRSIDAGSTNGRPHLSAKGDGERQDGHHPEQRLQRSEDTRRTRRADERNDDLVADRARHRDQRAHAASDRRRSDATPDGSVRSRSIDNCTYQSKGGSRRPADEDIFEPLRHDVNDVRMFEEVADSDDSRNRVQRVRNSMTPVAPHETSPGGSGLLLALRLTRVRTLRRAPSIDLLPLLPELPAARRRHCDIL
jgi:hypothetical protein